MQTIEINDQQAKQIRTWIKVAKKNSAEAYRCGNIEKTREWNERLNALNEMVELLGIEL